MFYFCLTYYIAFNVCSRESFVAAKTDIYKNIEQNAAGGIPLVLVGTKSDMRNDNNDDVSVAEAEKFASEIGVQYFEVSAKTGENVNEAIHHLAMKVYYLFSCLFEW